MLNRRILRIKAFKALYSSVLSLDSEKPQSLSDALSSLNLSCEAVRDLYIYMLGIVSPLTAVARNRIEALSSKIHKTEEDLHPNRKFADNALAEFLDNDVDFKKIWTRKKFSWGQYDIFLRKVYDSIREKEYYRKYMEKPGTSLKEDCRLFTRIFEEEFVDSPELERILEDLSIWWNDDLAYALTWCCRTLSDIARGENWKMLPLYNSDILIASGKAADSDSDFVRKLLTSAYAAWNKYSDRVSEAVPSREKDRLVVTDLCLIVCCLAEVTTFKEIPAKVSINEYVEISKFYGTPRSSVFVNGLLDRLVKELAVVE